MRIKQLDEALGDYFKAKRLHVGLSQSEVSRALGYTTPQFVSNFERGLCAPALAKMPVLLKLYKISASELTDVLTAHYRELVRFALSKGSKTASRSGKRTKKK